MAADGAAPYEHLVLIRFPEAPSAADLAWIDGQLGGWPQEIGGIRRHRWGTDVSGRSRGYQFAIVAEFDDPAAHDRYQSHPVHQRFAHWVADRGGEVLVFDFPVRSERASGG